MIIAENRRVVSFAFVDKLTCVGCTGRSDGTVGGRFAGASFGFYVTESFQSQTHTETMLYKLYNESR